MKGYFKIDLNAENRSVNRSSSRRTGEQILMQVERDLRKQGVEFVEDFDANNVVIVRYGEYVDDVVFELAMNPPTVSGFDQYVAAEELIAVAS